MPFIITPELNILNRPHSSPTCGSTEDRPEKFKEIFNRIDPTKEEKEKKEKCMISLWELPSEHFDEKEEKEELDSIEAAGAVAAGRLIHTPLMSAPCSPGALSDIAALFAHMVDQVELLSLKGDSKTTFFLKSSQFKNSSLYGTRITIEEFSTAPKAFNIQIATSPTALRTIQEHQALLMRAFHEGDYKFSIGRLDLELEQADTPLVHRKESVSDEEDRSP